MKFEIGKAYQHNSGKQLFIAGIADTVYHGLCFVAESGWQRDALINRQEQAIKDEEKMPNGGFDRKELVPISFKEDATINWFEIPKQIFILNNTSN